MTNENNDVRIARLDERMHMMHDNLDNISKKLDSINGMQVMLDRANREFPEIKSSLIRAHDDIGKISKSINHVRWFFMGVGAAFGFIGGAISETVRGLIKLIVS